MPLIPRTNQGSISGVTVPAGRIGETQEAQNTTLTNFPTSGNYGDLISFTLQPGVWDLEGIMRVSNNSASMTGETRIAISTLSGNNATGLVNGINQTCIPPATNPYDLTGSITGIKVNISVATTYYLKYRFSGTGTPQATGAIKATRIG